MRSPFTIAIAAATFVAGVGIAAADHYPGHHGNIYGPRNGTGSNYHPSQPNSGSDAWNQPRRPTVEHQWDRPRGTDPWNQPRNPNLDTWGKPKY